MARYKWSNVAVALGTLGAAQVVSALTLANPGVATYVGTDPANGTYFALTDVQGTIQVNNKLFRVANMNAGGNTLELEGENTSAYAAWVSGSLQPITFSTNMVSAGGVSASGGEFEFIDFTTIHDTQRVEIPGVASPTKFSFDCFWDPADTALKALRDASNNQTLMALRITFPGGAKFLLLGYVGATLAPTGDAQGPVKTSVVFTAFGASNTYAT